jgi:uncharacterized protein YecE (DUF72 family)
MSVMRIGTAGWSIPRAVAECFPSEGSSLERYSERFSVTEINSSFHRSHRNSTWERWRDSTPEKFRFAVKLPELITHQHKLTNVGSALKDFLQEAHLLGPKLAVLLVQLPPKHVFDAVLASAFFRTLRAQTEAAIACEPRHPSWFNSEVEDFLAANQVARVAADPALCKTSGQPGGWLGLNYWRLHGSPIMYRSSYSDRIGSLAEAMVAAGGEAKWCIFDNTASSAATQDALALRDALGIFHSDADVEAAQSQPFLAEASNPGLRNRQRRCPLRS